MLIAYQLVYYNAMVFAKISYLLFYLRIFVSRPFRIASWVCFGCSGAYWLGSVLQVFLTCRPFAFNWNPTIPGGKCASQNVAFSTIGAFNLITDLMIMILPLRFVFKLQMSTLTKWALSGTFGVGLLCVSSSTKSRDAVLDSTNSVSSISAITIIRIHVLTTVDFTDLPYSMIHAAFWSVTEPALAVANSCVPMIRPVLKAAFPNIFSTTHPTHGTKTPKTDDTEPHKKAFRRIHEDGEYPLTRAEDGVTKTDIKATSNDDRDYDRHMDRPQRRYGSKKSRDDTSTSSLNKQSYELHNLQHDDQEPREPRNMFEVCVVNEWSVSGRSRMSAA